MEVSDVPEGPRPAARLPSWSRGEIIVAAALAEKNGWRELRPTNPDVVALSALLRSANLHPGAADNPSFRGANSVSRKLTDLCTIHPGYTGKPTRGNRLDGLVVLDFLADPGLMHTEAAAISAVLVAGASGGEVEPQDQEGVLEGRLLDYRLLRRERSPKLRAAKLNQVRKSGGVLDCEVCGFNFGVNYGPRGEGYVEVHHVLPLHVSGAVKTSLDDLVLLCSNCHRMMHRVPWITPGELVVIRTGMWSGAGLEV